MKPERMSSLYILGEQSVIGGEDIIFVCSFAEAIDPERLYPAYERFIRARPLFRQKLRKRDESYHWEELSTSELEALLQKERLRIPQLVSREDLDRRCEETAGHLPMRITRIALDKLAFTFDHCLLTGNAACYWIDDWLQFLSQPAGEIPNLLAPPPLKEQRGLTAMILGYLACIAYVCRMLWELNDKKVSQVLNLAGARSLSVPRFASRTHEFTQEESKILLGIIKARKISISEFFIKSLSQELFDSQPESNRISISLPYDIGPFTRDFSRNLPGNFTGSMVIILHRGQDLAKQIGARMLSLRKRLRYWLSPFYASLLHGEQKVLDAFCLDARKSPMKRNVFSRLSCAATTGTILLRACQPPVVRMSGSGRTQTIYFGLVNFQDVISVECTIATDLYRPEEVFPIFDRLCKRLLKDSL